MPPKGSKAKAKAKAAKAKVTPIDQNPADEDPKGTTKTHIHIYRFIYTKTQHEPLAKRARKQLGRRDSDEAVERGIKRHFGHLPIEVVATHKMDGLVLREHIKRDRANLPAGGRLGSSYWVEMAGRMSRGVQSID
eukprot:15997656-Heterocapsa_arctica.AAC.1